MGLTIKAKSSKPKFTYQERSAEDLEKRKKSFSGRDSYFSDKAKFFITKTGDNKIRILPPTWDGAEHYGLDIWVHYGIGPDNVGYLCLDRMGGEKCPLCEARQEADRDGDEDLAKALKATRRVAVYVLDRNAEKDGPKVWAMPQRVDRDICAQAYDKETGEVLKIDHPDEGYDIRFTVEGQGLGKQYVGVQIARRASPILDDDKEAGQILEHLIENSLPDLLVMHDYDHVKKAFEGGSSRGHSDGESTRSSTKGGVVGKGSKEPAPEVETSSRPKLRIGAGKKEEVLKEEEVPDTTWDDVHEMDADGLAALAEERELDFGDNTFETVETCQDWVCKKLGIKKETVVDEDATTESAAPRTALRDRLRSLSSAGSKKK